MPLNPIRQELLINGTWTDITTPTRADPKIVITEGSSSEQTYLTSGSARFTLNNQNGTYTNSNPNSPYYGLLGRNIQYRTGLKGVKYVRMLDNSLSTTGAYDKARVSTTDKAALDITGDIDIRFDGEAEDWTSSYGQILCGKYNTNGDQRSWALYTQQGGDIVLQWTTDGTATTITGAGPTQANQAYFTAGRNAVRVTVDVDNGAGGRQVTWYKADTIAGPWTQFAQSTYTGTTSFFSSSAALEIGTVNDGDSRNTPFAGATAFVGKIYAFELRNGINGTLVAKMDATVQARGATSWSDGLGNTWTCQVSAVVDDMDYRFWGECAQLPQEWDTSGRDVWSSVQAGDLLQRLQKGSAAQPVASPMRRKLTGLTTPPAGVTNAVTGYWTLESNNSAIIGKPVNVDQCTFSSWSDVPGVEGGLTCSNLNSTMAAQASPLPTYFVIPPGYRDSSFTWTQQIPTTLAAGRDVMIFYLTGGTLSRIVVTCEQTQWTYRIIRMDGTTLGSATWSYGGTITAQSAIFANLTLTEDTVNGSLFVSWQWVRAGDAIAAHIVDSFAPGTDRTGYPRAWASPAFAEKSGMRLAHVQISQRSEVILWDGSGYPEALAAYPAETAFARFGRLMRENGYPYWIHGIGDLEGTHLNPQMGPQDTTTLITLLQECADVVGGILYAPRDKFGLALRMLSSMAGRDSFGPTLVYGATGNSYHVSGTLKPELVTQNIRNSVTATRPGGGARYRNKTSGTLNTNSSATDVNGVGVYAAQVSRNVFVDDQLQSQANWEVGVGTEDALRWPQVTAELHRAPFVANPALAASVRRLSLGDPFTLTGLPAGKGGPDDAPLLVRGRTETLENLLHTITFNAVPYGPYAWGQFANASANNGFGYAEGGQRRLDSRASTLAASATSTATSLSLATSLDTSAWSKATPYDVNVAGERVTINEMGSKGAVGVSLGMMESTATVGQWSGGAGGTPARSTTQRKYGLSSALLTVAGAPATASVLLGATANYAPATATLTYTCSLWLYSSIAITTNALARIDWYTAANALISSTTGTAASVAANTWTKITVTGTAPATTAKANYGLNVTGSPANGTLLYVDAIELINTAGTTWPCLVTRSVNGIIKAQNSGGAVRLVQSQAMRWGRI
jgi:hypothetical protein